MRVLWVLADEGGAGDAEARAVTAINECALEVVSGALEAIQAVRNCSYDVVVGESPLPGWTDQEWLEEVRRGAPNAPVIVRCPSGSSDDAVRLVKLGAYYYLGPEHTAEDAARVIEEAFRHRRAHELAVNNSTAEGEPWKRILVGESRAMKNIHQVIRMVAPRRSTVLITGETGTGKEMVARAIHMASGRGHLPLVAMNCNAIPAALLEAELFGHVKGAFTGAISHRQGRFEQAHRSTLFLDEIGDMPFDLQAKLLRVIQERELQRLGSSETIRLDVRIIAASNADLAERVREGKFREDLFYRLNVVPIRVPALRERLADVQVLVLHLIDKICKLEDVGPKQISPDALERLCSCTWPGNVRQLENAVEMAVALSGDRTTLYPDDFPLPSAMDAKPAAQLSTLTFRLPDEGLDFESTVNRIERSILEQALERTRGNKKLAADMLCLKRTTLSAKLKSLELATT